MWQATHTKFQDNGSGIPIILSTVYQHIWEAAILILQISGIYGVQYKMSGNLRSQWVEKLDYLYSWWYNDININFMNIDTDIQEILMSYFRSLRGCIIGIAYVRVSRCEIVSGGMSNFMRTRIGVQAILRICLGILEATMLVLLIRAFQEARCRDLIWCHDISTTYHRDWN
jgi:hypothetical protein